jgi:hypothetical protein
LFTDRKYTLNEELRHRIKDVTEEAGRKTTLELTTRRREDEGWRKEMIEKKRIKIRTSPGGEMTGRF